MEINQHEWKMLLVKLVKHIDIILYYCKHDQSLCNTTAGAGIQTRAELFLIKHCIDRLS